MIHIVHIPVWNRVFSTRVQYDTIDVKKKKCGDKTTTSPVNRLKVLENIKTL